jgi:DNA mismatch endonuclease, patch repair protein
LEFVKKTQDQIHKNMSHIRNKDTKIEILLRKELWSRGLRYRKNDTTTFGHPDVSFIRKKIAVFCDSEFWHGYDWDNRKNDLKTNREFWIQKIERNIQRDKEVNVSLEEQGWIVIRFWGKEIEKNLIACADEVEEAVRKR